MGKLAEQVAAFTRLVSCGNVEIYNEFSLQHEFGIFLRNRLANSKVQFERPTEYFFGSEASFVKKEIDIAVFSDGMDGTKNLQYSIELKFPRNGQYPEQMFEFCKDIAFAEQLHDAGFSTAGLVIYVDNHLFYSGRIMNGIYAFFRGNNPIHGRIVQPTGERDEEVIVNGTYSVHWQPVDDSLRNFKYAVIEIS